MWITEKEFTRTVSNRQYQGENVRLDTPDNSYVDLLLNARRLGKRDPRQAEMWTVHSEAGTEYIVFLQRNFENGKVEERFIIETPEEVAAKDEAARKVFKERSIKLYREGIVSDMEQIVRDLRRKADEVEHLSVKFEKGAEYYNEPFNVHDEVMSILMYLVPNMPTRRLLMNARRLAEAERS